MKILHVINIHGYGGAEKLLLQLLPALAKHEEIGCAILFQENTGSAAMDIGNRLKTSGIDVYLKPYKKWYSKDATIFVAGLISGQGYDLVHSHLKHADIWMARLKRSKTITIPVVSTMHGYNDAYENKFGFTLKRSIYFSAYYQFSRYIYSYLDGFIMISNVVDRFFERSGLLKGKKRKIIYHGYNGALLQNAQRKVKTGDNYKIAIPGRLIKRKGHSYLIEAVKLLKDRGMPVTLHVYGSGEEQGRLQLQVTALGMDENVFFYGYVDKLVEAISEMDVVVISSLWEGFGLVFLDAFAAGVPVVAFDLPAANEIITHEHNGLLAVPASVESLADNIERVLQDDQLKESICANAAKDLKIKYSMDKMAENYRNFYKEICNE